MTSRGCVDRCCSCCFSLTLCVRSINWQLIQGVTHLHPKTARIDSSRVIEIGRMDIKEPAGQDWQINTLLDQQCFPALPFLPHQLQKIKPPAPTASACGTSVAITVQRLTAPLQHVHFHSVCCTALKPPSTSPPALFTCTLEGVYF